MTLDVPTLRGDQQWYKLNTDFVGYYRVMYEDERDRELLYEAMASSELSELDQVQGQ